MFFVDIFDHTSKIIKIFILTCRNVFLRTYILYMATLNNPNAFNELVLQDQMDTELGTIYIYNSIVMMEAHENVTISIATGMFILLKLLTKIGTKPIVYISHRINSYSVDPNDYRHLEMIPNLKGIAVVSYSASGRSTAESLEKKFYQKPFQTFSNLTEATYWANEVLVQ